MLTYRGRVPQATHCLQENWRYPVRIIGWIIGIIFLIGLLVVLGLGKLIF
ncbi:hypothetical protein H8N03_17875 [Ramlibacter sp. USB13]|uniref:Uncharacterized protein n=1 Tax=Ramlibacter cellulosilyticus TaxID=2764187 RepID=A0A923SCE9_9BURK|nr:hypothetical protein [Ramlibacter cellulosilyticus]MBC5784824.1 hypothetical protein [Ramlibacter cellulosilyticus]